MVVVSFSEKQTSFIVNFFVGEWLMVLCFFSILPRLLSIAEETLAEFLSKATGTAVEWVQMPGMKVPFSY